MELNVIPKMDKLYIAGALNAPALEYIKNMQRMAKLSNKVQRMGNAVFTPSNDFLTAYLDGEMSYNDCFYNSLTHMLDCDAMVVTPKSEKSIGVAKEKEIAQEMGMPILENLSDVLKFNNRPKILAIVGESGSGKTTIAEYIQDEYDIPMIESHTDRLPRYEGETGHTFHSVEAYDELKEDEMIAFTAWYDKQLKRMVRYCCLDKDVDPLYNSYVIDEKGLMMMKTRYRFDYKVFSLRVRRPLKFRIEDGTDVDRIARDKGNFFLPDNAYDHVIMNDWTKRSLCEQIDEIVNSFFFEDWKKV